MNDASRATRAAATAAMLILLAGGCARQWADDPLLAPEAYERLGAIAPLSPESLCTPVDAPADAAPEPPAELPLTLAQCRADALANNLDLRVAMIEPDIAAEAVDIALARFEAALFASGSYAGFDSPTATSLEGSRVEVWDASAGVRVPLVTGGQVQLELPANRTETNNQFALLDPAYTTDARLRLSHPLLRGAGLAVNLQPARAARGNYDIQRARTKLEVIRVLATIDRVYWGLYAARGELAVRVEQFQLAEAQLERARRLVEVGSAPDVEVLRARAGVAERREAIIIAENILRQRQRQLKRLINRPDLELGTATELLCVTEPVVAPCSPQPDELAALAMERRMEMLELELQIALDATAIDAARNLTLPLLALDYAYTVNGLGDGWDASFEMLGDKRFEDHVLGLRLEVPLGNESATSALRQAVLRRVQRLATRDRRALLIREEVYDAADALRAAWQRVLAARQRVELAERVSLAEQRQFEQGLRTSTDVLDAQARLADARSAEISAVTDYQVALVEIAYATGSILGAAGVQWEPDTFSPLPQTADAPRP